MFGLQSFIRDMRRFKLLIIGGQAPVRRTIRNMLQALGLSNFREAEDGDEALRKLRTESFDFAVCEWELPLMNGPDVLRSIRNDEHLKHLPLLLVGGRDLFDRSGAAPMTHLDGLIEPPLLPQTLEDKMLEILFNNMRPTPQDRHLQAAGALLAKGRFAEAHQELDRAADIDARTPMVDYFRRMVYLSQGRPEEAEEALTRARKIFVNKVRAPREAARQVDLGRTLLDQGRVAQAGTAFNEALSLSVDDPSLAAEISEAYLSYGHAREAELLIKAFLEVNPDDVVLYNRLGMAYRKQQRFAEAVANFKKALEIAPHEENLHYNLARAHLSAGNRKAAVTSLEKALEIFPDFKEARDILHRIAH